MPKLPGRRFVPVYAALALLRVLVAFTSTSVIHPDEHFQNPEIAAGSVFDYGSDGILRTWEWQGTAPVRSIVSVLASTGIGFQLLKALVGHYPSARLLFCAGRCVMLACSFCADWLVWRTSGSSRLALLLWATSPVTLTFLLRPFSNSLETLCLAVVLYLAVRPAGPRLSTGSRALFGAVVAYGCFVRVTFAAYALPACLFVSGLLPASPTMCSMARIPTLAAIAFGGICATLVCVAFDDRYFFGPWHDWTSTFPPITPLNLLRYNLKASNLQDHGLHPRYLHLLVNWPMLLGPAMPAIIDAARTYFCRDEKGRTWKERVQAYLPAGIRDRVALQRSTMLLYLATLAVPTLALSVQPHQEPRFLVPLLVPCVLVAARAPFLTAERDNVRRKRLFWSGWLLHSVLLTFLFGYMHQGGLLPATFALNDDLRAQGGLLGSSSEVDLVFWKTFMPPRHLLLPLVPPSRSVPVVQVTDLAGAPFSELLLRLASLPTLSPNTSEAAHGPRRAVLVAPENIPEIDSLRCDREPAVSGGTDTAVCIEPLWRDRTSFGVHVDMDRLDEVLKSRGRVGVGVWTVRRVA
ncbi:alpha 1,2 mannosyltransferase [Rhodotorula sphaerocarpa]